MKFAFPSALILVTFGAVLAQDSSSAAPATSTSAPASSTSSSMPASMSMSSGSSAAAAKATCSLFSGDPSEQPFGCVEGATTVTPPYDSASLAAFQVGAYTPGVEGEPIGSVASDMAKTVTEFYPTLTVAFSDIVNEYSSVLSASATNFTRDGAVGTYHIPGAASMMAMVFVAVMAGGAFVL